MENIHNREFGIIILAAGKGTRMESDMIKVLHPVAGHPMLHYVLRTAEELSPTKIVVVVGHQADQVKEAFKSHRDLEWVLQKNMKGTGDAVKVTADAYKDFRGPILILYGDIPGIRVETLRRLRMLHDSAQNAVTLLTADLEDPTGYGRVMVSVDGSVSRIVEEKDASLDERDVTEVNTGIGIYDPKFLFEAVARLKPVNQQGEYYLTDVIYDARAHGRTVGRMQIKEPLETLGVNDRSGLAEVTRFFEDEKATRLLLSGVTLEDPGTSSIHPDVRIEKDTIVQGRVLIAGKTTIDTRSKIEAGAKLIRAEVGENVLVGSNVVMIDIEVGEGSVIGANSTLCEGD